MIEIQVRLVPIKAEFEESVSPEIQDARLSIFSKELATLISGLEDYIRLLLDQKDRKQRFSKNVPWKIEGRAQGWAFADEIVASSILLVLNYQQLASAKVLTILKKDDAVEEDRDWKVSNNWLKQSISLVNFLITSGLYNNSIDILTLEFLNFLNHLLDSAVQLNLLAKINFAKVSKIKQNDWNFNIDTTNNLIYLKICIFIADELSICEQIANNLPGQKKIVEAIRIHRLYIKIYIAYYLSLEHYEKGKIGLSIGIINYIKSHLLKDEENNDDDLNNKLKRKVLHKFSKSSQNEKDLIKQIASDKDFKIDKKFLKLLAQTCSMDLDNLVRLINLINLKLLKENDNIRFDKVSGQEEVIVALSKVPMGRKIPLTIDALPSFLQNDDSKKKYIGSGSYF